jgi:hypothetical protein
MASNNLAIGAEALLAAGADPGTKTGSGESPLKVSYHTYMYRHRFVYIHEFVWSYLIIFLIVNWASKYHQLKVARDARATQVMMVLEKYSKK